MLEASRRRQKPVAEIPGVGEKTAERLVEAGVATLGDLLEKSAAELAEIPGIGEKSAEKIIEAARAAESEASEESNEYEAGSEDDESPAEAPAETGVRE
jgi:DNA repair protein RadA